MAIRKRLQGSNPLGAALASASLLAALVLPPAARPTVLDGQTWFTAPPWRVVGSSSALTASAAGSAP